MKGLTVFDFNGNNVRTITVDNEPLFVAKDICDILALKNPSTSLSLLDDDEKSYIHRTELGLKPGRRMVSVSESGMYALVIQSRKPEAKLFRKWITSDVLPTIRKTNGVYLSDQKTEELLADPDLIIGMALKMKQIKLERDEAIRTKAHIGKGRESKAMGTAGAATVAKNRAELELRKITMSNFKLKSDLRLRKLQDEIRETRFAFKSQYTQPCANCVKEIKKGNIVFSGKVGNSFVGVVHQECNESYTRKLAVDTLKVKDGGK